MISSTTNGLADDKTKSRMAETRRQIIGICRKLPLSVVDYLNKVTMNNSEENP